MRVVIHQPTFIPWPGFFNKLKNTDLWILLDTDKFNEEEFQNRNRIRVKSPINWKWLTIPIAHQYHDVPIREVCVGGGDWINYHLSLLAVYYSNSPYYKDMLRVISEEYESILRLSGRSWTTAYPLSMLNLNLIEKVKKLLGIENKTLLASELFPPPELKKSDLLIWLLEQVKSDHYLAGRISKGYLELEKFERKGIKVEFHNYQPTQYTQMSYSNFVPDLSVIDMLMNVGPGKARDLI